jgi:hypothetical protein
MQQKNKIEQWEKELAEIASDVTDLIENQHIFHRLGEIIQTNPKINKDNFFWDHLKANYGAALVIGIARQVDERKDVVSLMRLLKDLERNNGVITRQWFVDQYKPDFMKAIGEQHFTDRFGNGIELDNSIIKKDIEELTLTTANVEKFRHTRIAHRKKDRGLEFDLSFQEVDTALASLEKLVIKYEALLNQAGFERLMPSILYDWEEIFCTPWIEKNGI